MRHVALGIVLVSVVACSSTETPLRDDGGAGGSRDAGANRGADADCICEAIYAPVCGTDGTTYGSSCAAACVGAAVAYAGACNDAGGPDVRPRGYCDTDNDCVFKADDGCCGSCLAQADAPEVLAPLSCGAVDCAAPPGGCTCVNHSCARGTITSGMGCDTSHDLCGLGLKCCQVCGGAPVLDGGAQCGGAVCMTAFISGGLTTCPAAP
jgi:hypothetical protein